MEKEAHLANLVKIAQADGQIHPMESMFIKGIAMRMGIDNTAFERIARSPQLASQMQPNDEETKLRNFCELVILSQVDFNKSEDERKLLHEMGNHLHIPSEKVDKLEEYLKKNKLSENVSKLMEEL